MISFFCSSFIWLRCLTKSLNSSVINFKGCPVSAILPANGSPSIMLFCFEFVALCILPNCAPMFVVKSTGYEDWSNDLNIICYLYSEVEFICGSVNETNWLIKVGSINFVSAELVGLYVTNRWKLFWIFLEFGRCFTRQKIFR